MVDGTAAIAVVEVTAAAAVEVVGALGAAVEVVGAVGAAVEVIEATVDGGAAAGTGGEPEQAPRTTSKGIALHDVRGFLTSS